MKRIQDWKICILSENDRTFDKGPVETSIKTEVIAKAKATKASAMNHLKPVTPESISGNDGGNIARNATKREPISLPKFYRNEATG